MSGPIHTPKAPETGCGINCGPCTKCKDLVLPLEDLLDPIIEPIVEKPDRYEEIRVLRDESGGVHTHDTRGKYDGAGSKYDPSVTAKELGVIGASTKSSTSGSLAASPVPSHASQDNLVTINRVPLGSSHSGAGSQPTVAIPQPLRVEATSGHLSGNYPSGSSAAGSAPQERGRIDQSYKESSSTDRHNVVWSQNRNNIEKNDAHRDAGNQRDRVDTAKTLTAEVKSYRNINRDIVESRSEASHNLQQTFSKSSTPAMAQPVRDRSEGVRVGARNDTHLNQVPPREGVSRSNNLSVVREVHSKLAHLEQSLTQRQGSSTIRLALNALARSAKDAAALLPAMVHVTQKVSTVSRVFEQSTVSKTLATQIVQANLMDIRSSVMQAVPAQIRASMKLENGSPPRVESTTRASNERMQQTARKVQVSRPTQGLVEQRTHEFRDRNLADRPLRPLRDLARNHSSDMPANHRTESLQRRIAGELNSATRAGAHRYNMQERLNRKVRTEVNVPKTELGKERPQTHRDPSRRFHAHQDNREVKAEPARRPNARRFDLLKRALDQQKEQRALRRRPPQERGLDAALQQELTNLNSKSLKRLAHSKEEELLGLLSSIEQLIMRRVSKKLEAATTLDDLKKSLKKAKKGKSSSSNDSSSDPIADQGSTGPHGGGNAKQTADNSQDVVLDGAQPSRTLDLITGKVNDDGDLP